MNLVGFTSTHARAILVLTALVSGLGIVAGWSLPSDIYPPLRFPRIVVIGHAGTTPARSMMLTITRPLEQALLEVPGTRRVRSLTFRGATEISVQFEPSTDMLVALQQAQSSIAETRQQLPADLQLTVDRLTPAAFPMLSLNVSGSLPIADLYDYAFYVMRPEFARVAGAGRVEVLASDTREIEVVADPARLLAAGLTVHELATALRETNQIAPVGRLAAGGLQRLLLASALWDSAAQIGATPLITRENATVRVADVAHVFPGTPDRTTLVTGGGRPAVAISVSLQVGANALDVRRGIDEQLTALRRTLPSGIHIAKTYDLAEFVSAAIANVRDAILIGALLAVVVLIVFLRSWRLTLIASLTVPLTVLATFLVMRLAGSSINLMSMGGLAVAIGLVIDDAVVVVENIFRRMSEGGGTAAIDGAVTELVGPVVSSTVTTVVVFVPLGLLSGTVGDFFRALSLTLTAAVLVSLVLALTLIPVLARALARPTAEPRAPEHHEGVFERAYVRTLPTFVGRPLVAVLTAVALMLLAVVTYQALGTGFLPAADEGGFVIDYLTPAGTALEETDARVRNIERILAGTPEVAAYSRRTGSELGLFATQQNKGDILVRLKPLHDRQRSAEAIIEDLREQLQRAVPDLEIEFVQLLQDMIGDLEGNPSPIEVKVFGNDPDVLASIGEQIERQIAHVDGIVDIVGMQRGNPESIWQIDPVAAGRLGLAVSDVAAQLSANWLGEIATELRLQDRTIPVRVRLPDRDRFDPARLRATIVRGTEHRMASLGTLATLVESNGQSELHRENLRQMALVTARLENRDLGSAVSDLRQRLRGVRLPVGYTVEVGGQYDAQRRAFRELLLVFGSAVALVFVVLIVQFRRFVPALLILAAAPLSLGGAFLLLFVAGIELNVSSAMGLILLVGLIVKNGIVMLDYAHRLHDAGRPLEAAVLTAGRIRLRPILMTTLCTLFGLLPLAFGLGAGAELQRPLAVAVIGGLTVSLFVTLYIVPSLYLAARRSG
jgi:CzcA family heavy metal efflux pump